MIRKIRMTSDYKLNQKRCESCPFRDDGCIETRNKITSELLERSHICHSTGNSLCRGARDFQLNLLYRIGLLPEPTDQAWSAKQKT